MLGERDGEEKGDHEKSHPNSIGEPDDPVGMDQRLAVKQPQTRTISSEHRQRIQKKPKLKLKKIEELGSELEAYRKKYATFDEIYKHTLGYYFLSQYIRERRLTACFDFVNKVDVYRGLQKPTKRAAESALGALRHVAIIQSSANADGKTQTRTPPNALPVEEVVAKLKDGRLDRDVFDKCYARVKEVLVSFYTPFLKSKYFVRFVQFMEYSRRQIKPGDLQSLAPLGQGAFGRVVAVEKRDTRALFAMKEIPKSVLRKHKTGWMCLNEMQLLSRTKSPFVLSLKYSFHSERAVHLVFEMCMGGDLRQYLEKGAFDLKRTTFYVAEILLGIDHIHSLEYCYRDLKPSNILLTQTGHCKISDLGLVVRLPKPPKVLKHVAGTPGYWPPEIVARTGTYPSSDYWSLGVLTYAMLAGKKIPDPLDGKRPGDSKKRSKRRSSRKAKEKSEFKSWSPFSSHAAEQKVAKKDPKMKYIDATIKFPESIKGDARDFIERMLVIDPKKRLGGTKGLKEIKRHPLFKELDWQALSRLESEPPFVPPKRILDKRRKTVGKTLEFQPVKVILESINSGI
uniref:Protein kinase domain-containing protein n=1 Tax=Lotharella globosa TaxID=91324 RepID=A0A7S3YHI2_9EUKA